MAEATVAFLSFRLGGPDGVSVVAETWRQVFEDLGFRTRTVAGEGPVDRIVPGLAIDATTPPAADELERALDRATDDRSRAGIAPASDTCGCNGSTA